MRQQSENALTCGRGTVLTGPANILRLTWHVDIAIDMEMFEDSITAICLSH